MARWASLVEARRSERPVLLVDAGDFLPTGAARYQDVHERCLFESMRLLGYDAVGAGEIETRAGLAPLARRAAAYRLPLVCSNVIDGETKRHPLPREIVRDLRGAKGASGAPGIVRVGIASVTLPEFVRRAGSAEGRRHEATDQRLAALESVTRLRSRGCHLVVVLSHCGWEKSVELAREVPGIDIVVNAHQETRMTFAERVGSTTVIGVGRKEYDLAEISVVFGPGPPEISVKNRCPDALDSPDDSRLLDQKRRCAEEIKALSPRRTTSRATDRR